MSKITIRYTYGRFRSEKGECITCLPSWFHRSLPSTSRVKLHMIQAAAFKCVSDKRRRAASKTPFCNNTLRHSGQSAAMFPRKRQYCVFNASAIDTFVNLARTMPIAGYNATISLWDFVERTTNWLRRINERNFSKKEESLLHSYQLVTDICFFKMTR